MKRLTECLISALTVVLWFGFPASLSAQMPGPIKVSEPVHLGNVRIATAQGTLVIPSSSLQQTPPAGEKFAAHTDVEIFMPAGVTPDELPPFADFGFETPASLACVYSLVTPLAAGCNPNSTTTNPSGGSGTIAIVDPFDDPEIYGDLAFFSLQFGIPLTLDQFQVVQAVTLGSSCFGGSVPIDETGGSEIEEALDVEWAHAMAPAAKIFLVEGCSNFASDLQQGVKVANNLVRCGLTEINPTTGVVGTCPSTSTGKGEVSMSWGGPEFEGENGSTGCAAIDDSCFTTPGVVYVAASGDSPGVQWPSTSPNVVSAGGLTTRRNPATFNFIQQTAWVDAGGGPSAIEAIPSYQSGVASVVGKFRGTPDLSFDADPITGVYVYDTFPIDLFEFFQWFVVGGTSVAAPSLAGIINRAGGFSASSNAENTKIYTNRAVTTDFSNITSAYCGPYQGFTAGAPYSFCGGVGADKGYTGK